MKPQTGSSEVVPETGWTVEQTINQLEQEATREGLPASTVHRLKIAATTLAALSPAQTGGTPVAWRFRYLDPVTRWTVQKNRPAWYCAEQRDAEVQPLYAAPVAEGAREDSLQPLREWFKARDLYDYMHVDDADVGVPEMLEMLDALQPLDTGTNRGGGPR